jgi:hypothetical protein
MDRFTAPPMPLPSTTLQFAEPFLIGHSTTLDLALIRACTCRNGRGLGVGRATRAESGVSIGAQSPLPGPERMPPLPPDVVPPPLDTPAETPPEIPPAIREPDLPGQHAPISDGPRFSSASPSGPSRAVALPRPAGALVFARVIHPHSFH